MMTMSNAEQTMSSREIAEATGKLHKNVMDDIRNIFDQLEIEPAEFLAHYLDSKGLISITQTVEPQVRGVIQLPHREDVKKTGFNSRNTADQLTMSSREIAELVEKRHDSVKRTIEMLMAHGTVQPQSVDEPATDAMGRTRFTKVYYVNQRDSYVIVAQLSPEFTARLVDRWQELEKQVAGPQLPNFNNPVEAARAWADTQEQLWRCRHELVSDVLQVAETISYGNPPVLRYVQGMTPVEIYAHLGKYGPRVMMMDRESGAFRKMAL